MGQILTSFELLGDVEILLQMRVFSTYTVIALDQERQVFQLTADYGGMDCKSVLTPMVVHMKLENSKDPPQATIPFMQLAGSPLWIARHTHPEVMQSVVYLILFCTCSTCDHYLRIYVSNT